MNDPKSAEFWQVEVNGQVYEAGFAELADWIAEGSLQPDDRVRRGNLRWIEARRVPNLVPFFNAKANGTPPPVVVSTTVAENPPPQVQQLQVPPIEPPQHIHLLNDPPTSNVPAEVTPVAPTKTVSVQTEPDFCVNHPDRPSKFICLSCSITFCRDCVKAFGSSVTICMICGDMCKSRADVEKQQKTKDFKSASLNEGFGFGDFGAAIAYPFKFKASLFFGAVMFMFFSLGKSASAMGGIYMIVAAIFSYMLANMLTFGILANTVDSFAHGKIGNNFMPSFDDFALWDDVIHPFFLWIAATLSSFGPFLLISVVGAYLVFSSIASQMSTEKNAFEGIPGTPSYSGISNTMKQSEQVKGVLGNSSTINQQHLDQVQQLENGEAPAPSAANQEEENFQQLNKQIADSKRQELESVVGKSPETRARESEQFVNGLLRVAAPLVVFGFITFLWGAFYFPAASIVAGYTKSFTATINPLVGLDTIKRLGFDYVKILLMGFLLIIATGIVSLVIAFVFSPFDMPGMGNLPAKALSSLFEFYIWIVFACILGFAIFKASDRLKLHN